jgi:hypothetical protein
LENDLGAFSQRRAGRVCVAVKIATVDFDNRFSRSLQLFQVRRLMGITLFLQQGGILAVLPWLGTFASQVHEI